MRSERRERVRCGENAPEERGGERRRLSAVSSRWLKKNRGVTRERLLLGELIAEVPREFPQLRIDLSFADLLGVEHAADCLDDNAPPVDVEGDWIAQTGFLKGPHNLPAALETSELVEEHIADLWRDCDRPSDGLDEWHDWEAIA
jgi:hypothetical protein